MHKQPITSVKFLKNDKQAASSSLDGQIILWDLTSTKQMKPLQMIARLSSPSGSLQSVTKMVFNSQANELLALSIDKRVTYWSVNDKKITKQLQAGLESEVNALEVSPDGQLIVVGDDSGEMKLFTYDDCRLIHMDAPHFYSVCALAVSPDNTLILTADENG